MGAILGCRFYVGRWTQTCSPRTNFSSAEPILGPSLRQFKRRIGRVSHLFEQPCCKVPSFEVNAENPAVRDPHEEPLFRGSCYSSFVVLSGRAIKKPNAVGR